MTDVVLRISGKNFDADKFIVDSGWNVITSWKKGDKRNHSDVINKDSGLNMDIYSSEGSDVDFKRIVSFINENKTILINLKRMHDILVVVDIGIMESEKFVFVRLDKELLSLVLEYDLDLELSFYSG